MADSALRIIDIDGRPPDETNPARATLALFIALQVTRTTEHREGVLFPRRVLDWAGTRPVTRELVAEYVETEHLGFAPDPREVDGRTRTSRARAIGSSSGRRTGERPSKPSDWTRGAPLSGSWSALVR